MDVGLWDALGRPPPGGLLPAAKTPAWREARLALQDRLRHLRARFRSPRALWALLYGGSPPPGSTWRDLCAPGSWSRLGSALALPSPTRLAKFVSWNCQWLVSPTTDAGRIKRATVRRWLDQGRIVALQETHWSLIDVSTWASLLPGCSVVASPARPGPAGGPQGGVALLVPDRFPVLERRDLVPGLFVAAKVDFGEYQDWVCSAYIPPPPAPQLQFARALLAAGDGLRPLFFRGRPEFGP